MEEGAQLELRLWEVWPLPVLQGDRGRNREGILSTLTLQSLLRSLSCPNSSGAWGKGAHHVGIRGSLLLTFLEKFSFSDKRVQVWMAFPLTPFLPCSNKDMMAKGHHQLSYNREATGMKVKDKCWSGIIGAWVSGSIVKQVNQLLLSLSSTCFVSDFWVSLSGSSPTWYSIFLS